MKLLSYITKHFANSKAASSILAMALLTVGFVATPASAGYVDATFSTVNPGQIVTIHSGSFHESGWAGVYKFINASSSPGVGLNGSLNTFCIDISQNITFGQTAHFDVIALSAAPNPPTGSMQALKANLISELWYNHYADSLTSDSNAAAFQIAIWEIINETNANLNVGNGNPAVNGGPNAGSFWVEGPAGTLTTANTWLAGLDLSGAGPKAPGLVAMTNPTYQDYVVQATPAPPGFVLGMTGAFAMLFPMVWRSRKWLPLSLSSSAKS